MAGFIESLGQGLQGAGEILSPAVAQRHAQERDLLLRSTLALRQAQRELAARTIVSGVQSGSIDPQVGRQKLSELGFGDIPVGPSLEAQGTKAFIDWQGGHTEPGAPATPVGSGMSPQSGMELPPPAAMASPLYGRYINAMSLERSMNKPTDRFDANTGKIIRTFPDGRAPQVIDVPGLGKGQWSEPYKMGDAWVQKNNNTGEIRTAVARPPVTAIYGEKGRPPAGYRWSATDPNKLEPIPGGPAAAGQLTDEAVDFAIGQFFAGDKSALTGLARNKEAKAKVMNRIPIVAKEQGLDPKQVALAQAEYQGMVQGERTLGARQAQIEMAGTVLKQFVPIAIAASKEYQRFGIKSVNDLQNAVLSGTASPELRRLNAAVNAVVNAYGRAINPTGVASDTDKNEARKILDAGFAQGDFEAAANQLMTEIKAELKAPGEVKKGMGEFFTGKKTEEPTTTAPKKLTYDPATGTFK